MTKKIVCFILIACMTAAIAASCRSGGSSSDGGTPTPGASSINPQTETPAESQTETPADTQEETPAPSYEDQRYTVTYALAYADMANVTGMAYEERYGPQTWAEKFNVDLKIDTITIERFNLMWATNDLPDICIQWFGSALDYLDFVVDITDYWNGGRFPNAKAMVDQWPDQFENFALLNGRLYGTPTIVTEAAPQVGYVVNKTALDEAGIPFKYDMTYEDFYELMKAYKEYKPSSYPYTFDALDKNLMNYGPGWPGDTNWSYNYREDIIVAQATNPGIRETVELFAKMYDEGLLHPEYLTIAMDQKRANIVNRDAIMWVTWIQNNPIGPGRNVDVSEFTDELVGVLPPQYAKEQKRWIPAWANNVVSNGYFISRSVLAEEGKLDRIIDMLDWRYSEEGINAFVFGEEGISFYYDSDGRKQYTDDWIYARDNPDSADKKFDQSYYQDFTNLINATMLVGKTNAFYDYVDLVNATSEDDYFRPYNLPGFTLSEEETSEMNGYTTPLNDYWLPMLDQMVMGTRPIGEWDSYMEQLSTLGLDRMIELRNMGYEASKTR